MLTQLDGVPALRPVARLGMRILFDRLAPDWERIRDGDPAHREGYERGLGELPRRFPQLRRPPSTILDVACGTGLACGVLRARFPTAWIVGTDIAPKMVTLAHRLVPGTEFLVARSDQIPFNDGGFELVTSLDGIFEISELARVCAPGGAMFLTYTHSDIPVRRPLPELAAEAQAHGFTVITDDTRGSHYLWALKTGTPSAQPLPPPHSTQ